VNEQANQNATHGALPKRNSLNEPVAAASVNLNAAKDITSGRMPGDFPGSAPGAATCKVTVDGEALPSNHKDTTSDGPIRRLSRQFSGDSQRSGNRSQSVFYSLNMNNLQYILVLPFSLTIIIIVYCTCHLRCLGLGRSLKL